MFCYIIYEFICLINFFLFQFVDSNSTNRKEFLKKSRRLEFLKGKDGMTNEVNGIYVLIL